MVIHIWTSSSSKIIDLEKIGKGGFKIIFIKISKIKNHSNFLFSLLISASKMLLKTIFFLSRQNYRYLPLMGVKNYTRKNRSTLLIWKSKISIYLKGDKTQIKHMPLFTSWVTLYTHKNLFKSKSSSSRYFFLREVWKLNHNADLIIRLPNESSILKTFRLILRVSKLSSMMTCLSYGVS